MAENAYVKVYVPESAMAIRGIAVLSVTVPIFAKEITEPKTVIKENGTGSASKISIAKTDALFFIFISFLFPYRRHTVYVTPMISVG